MWYCSADALFCQLPSDHNMDVQYQRYTLTITPFTILQSLYGRTHARTVMWLPNFLAGALHVLGLRYKNVQFSPEAERS